MPNRILTRVILNHNRDAVKGFVETKEENSLSSSVRFKRELNGESEEWVRKTFFGFETNQEVFRSIRFSHYSKGNMMDIVFAKRFFGDWVTQ